jgi:hypothetical protein
MVHRVGFRFAFAISGALRASFSPEIVPAGGPGHQLFLG